MANRNGFIRNEGFGEKLAQCQTIRRYHGDRMLERTDVIVGGFPCQDISTAGRGAGITGSRSGLWKWLLCAIRLVRPRIALVENVPMLLNRGMGTVLGDLAESGYDTEWDCFSACEVGAPHVRERLFIMAYPLCHGIEKGGGIRRRQRRNRDTKYTFGLDLVENRTQSGQSG